MRAYACRVGATDCSGSWESEVADAQREGVDLVQRGLLQGCNKGCDCGGYLSGQEDARWKYARDVTRTSATVSPSANTARGPRTSRCRLRRRWPVCKWDRPRLSGHVRRVVPRLAKGV